MSNVKTPKDLANRVFDKLLASKFKGTKPPENVLLDLFNTLFYASLATEESDFIQVTVTLLTKEFRKSPSKNEVLDEPRLYEFDEPIEFTEKNLIKLSKAADPWSSSLAVDYDDDGKLMILGMIDQALHFQSFLNYERDEQPKTPGLIQTVIEDVGALNVFFEYQPLATLNKSRLTYQYIDVFKSGPIADRLLENTIHLKKKAGNIIKSEKFTQFSLEEWEEDIEKLYIQSICRILLKVKSYHHGGALLITNNYLDGLIPKYTLAYDRLEVAQIDTLGKYLLFESVAIDLDEIESKKKTTVPMEYYQDYAESIEEIQSAEHELKGAVRFIASLTCVDGLVVLSDRLHVKNFGTVITDVEPPDYVYVSSTAIARTNLRPLDPRHFGTRHRSVFAYCAANPNSIGFIISQDGEIRAVMMVGNKLVMWEHIKVHQFLKSKKILPIISKR